MGHADGAYFPGVPLWQITTFLPMPIWPRSDKPALPCCASLSESTERVAYLFGSHSKSGRIRAWNGCKLDSTASWIAGKRLSADASTIWRRRIRPILSPLSSTATTTKAFPAAPRPLFPGFSPPIYVSSKKLLSRMAVSAFSRGRCYPGMPSDFRGALLLE